MQRASQMRFSRTVFWAWLGLCAAAMPVPDVVAQEESAEAPLLKAAFVYNFAKFTRWPEQAWDGPMAPLRLCIAGTDGLATSLARLADERVDGREVVIDTYAATDRPCHVLYIADSERGHLADYIEQTRSRPVLTISEIPRFADAGGIIQLYRDRGRVRFKINVAGARSSGLNLSARLLDLADVIDRQVTP